jgi:hypothetical protein
MNWNSARVGGGDPCGRSRLTEVVVPRDRIELSTQPFQYDEIVVQKMTLHVMQKQ